MSETSHPTETDPQLQGSIAETLKQLIFAFVLAMAFRGFVLEGFVIPTGSMAPTLLGDHVLIDSKQTGFTFPIDARAIAGNARANGSPLSTYVYDPMLGPGGTRVEYRTRELLDRVRMGDRVLVLKCLYPFFGPDRWDVVVFKNPTDPVGETQNYIKRLVGLPNEHVRLTDGDLFTKGPDDPRYFMRRKPEYVQRAVWRPIYSSDYLPVGSRVHLGYNPPWKSDDGKWEIEDRRSFRRNESAPSILRWNNQTRVLNDWASYNMHRQIKEHYPVSDLRFAAGIDADDFNSLQSVLTIDTRGHRFEFELSGAVATMRIRGPESERIVAERSAEIELPDAGEVVNVEFWHVDQTLWMFIDGERAMEPLQYNWTPDKRLQFAFFGRTREQYRNAPLRQKPTPPKVAWQFSGSPLTLHRVRVDRDIYYSPSRLTAKNQDNLPRIPNSEYKSPLGFGVDPDQPAVLGPDHFMMLGDNSPASKDSRVWGSPHKLVAEQIDDAPFVVNRKLLLGKAWAVYFPSPYSLSEGGRSLIPDTGRLRFIR